jgi:hypothetical protein
MRASWFARYKPRTGDDGAASLEYAGSLFVVVLLISSLVLGATPIGAAIKGRICAALGAACGTYGAEQRAKDLGIKCVVSKADDKMNINASVELRGERTDKGSSTSYGDGTGQVVLSQGVGVGYDASSELGDYAAAKFKVTANGDAGLVYKFPTEYGGSTAADDFLAGRRDATHTTAEILLPPGTQALEEGAHRAWNGTKNWVQDDVLGFFGHGPGPAEREARDRQQRAGTADAVQVAISLQGSAGVDAGAGVKRKTNNADGSTSEAELRAPASANVTANAALTGTITIPLHTDGPDAISASFTGEISGDLSGNVTLGGAKVIPPFLNASGIVGGKGSYTVGFDAQGNPTSLTITTETQAGYGYALNPKAYDKKTKAKTGGKNNAITTTTQMLDLKPGTPEGNANLAAFNDAFDVVGGNFGGHTAKIVIPKAMRTAPGQVIDPIKLATSWAGLQQRLGADAFTVTTESGEHTTEYGGDIKVAGVGLGGTYSDTSRQLISSTLHDNRYGVDLQVASCPS